MKVSVIIPTYNRKKILKKCLEFLSCQKLSDDDYEVITVDNGSTDGTREMINSLFPSSRIRYFHEPRRGPHIARNLGIKHAKGEIILFVDSDIFAPPHLIQEHINYHKEFQKAIVSGPTVRTSRSEENFSDIEKRKRRELFYWSGACFITSNLSVRKEYLVQIGGFDEQFQGLGWHDWDLGLRLSKLGLQHKRNVNAIVYHYKKKRELVDLPHLVRRRVERGRNAVLYYKKHSTFKVKLGIRAYQLLTDKFFWWLDSALGEKALTWARENKEKILLNLLIQWKLNRGYVQGLREGMEKYKVKLWP